MNYLPVFRFTELGISDLVSFVIMFWLALWPGTYSGARDSLQDPENRAERSSIMDPGVDREESGRSLTPSAS